MANYTYGCFACEEAWEVFCIPIAERDKPQKCIICDSYECVKRIIQPISFSFNEVDKAGDSSKPAEYWDNAESEKHKKLIKEQNQTLEKAFYNDPTCPEKYKQLKGCVK